MPGKLTTTKKRVEQEEKNRRNFIKTFAGLFAGLTLFGGGKNLAKPSSKEAGLNNVMSPLAGAESYMGSICIFAGTYAPRDWAFCNGQTLSISQYTALYAILGTQFGGDGVTNFRLPDLQGRVPVGAGNGIGLTPRQQGQYSGIENVALTTNQLPAHSHTVKCDTASSGRDLHNSPNGNLPANSVSTIYGANPSNDMNGNMVTQTGGGQAHTNMQPWLALNYIICVNGLFPPRN